MSPFVFTSMCFLFLCYFLQFFNYTLCTHVFLNSRTLKKTQLLVANENNFWWLHYLFSSLSFPLVPFIFLLTHHLLINTSSLKLWWPITTTFYVPYTTTWKHITSSLWMNTSYLIFWLFYIHSLPKLVMQTPCHSPYTPSTNYANTFVKCTNTFVDHVNKSTNYAHTFDDCVNTSIELANTTNTPTSYFYIIDSSFCTSWSILLKNTNSLLL